MQTGKSDPQAGLSLPEFQIRMGNRDDSEIILFIS